MGILLILQFPNKSILFVNLNSKGPRPKDQGLITSKSTNHIIRWGMRTYMICIYPLKYSG